MKGKFLAESQSQTLEQLGSLAALNTSRRCTGGSGCFQPKRQICVSGVQDGSQLIAVCKQLPQSQMNAL